MITTVADLFSRYADLCGVTGPELTRDGLRADFQKWCAMHDIAARYEVSGESYLAADDGPFRRFPQAGEPQPWPDPQVVVHSRGEHTRIPVTALQACARCGTFARGLLSCPVCASEAT